MPPGNIPLHKAAQSGSLLSALLLLDRIQAGLALHLGFARTLVPASEDN